MDKLLGQQSHYFNAFYQDNSLLLQFIISEFIKTHPFILEINGLVDKHLHPPYPQDIPLDAFLQILRRLVGTLSTDQQQTFPIWAKGLLTKLKEYSEQLPRNSHHKDKNHINLRMALHQTWVAAIHCVELLNALTHEENSPRKKTELLKALKRNMVALHKRYQQALRYLAGSFKGQLRNENILLCLLRGKAILSQMYGYDYLHKKLKCPIRDEHFLKVLLSKYRERGFDHLPVTIEQPHAGITSL